MSKILEKIVSVKLVNHLDRNNLLHPGQFGFQCGKSTEQNLTETVNFRNAMNEGHYSIGFFLLKKIIHCCST
jgi:hypothetical protein